VNERQHDTLGDGGQAAARGWARAAISRPFRRRAILRAALAGAGAVVAGLLAPTGAAQTPTGGSPTPTDGFYPSPAPGVPDAYTTAPPLFRAIGETPGSGGTTRALFISYAPPVPARDENRYWQELERRLGVTLEPTFVPGGTYPEQIAVTTAGGDFPELTTVWTDQSPELYRTIEQGAFTDLTDRLSGDALQEFPNLAAFPDFAWENVRIDGRIYGVPRPRVLPGAVLMFRRDWAEKHGIPEPKNAEEFFELMVAFTEGDPDGNGQADSFGLGNQGGNTYALDWARAMFRAPNAWRLEADGGLTSEYETEEFRAALEYTRRLFDAGVFHPDAATMNVNQAKELFAAGRIGAYLDGLAALPGSGGLRGTTAQVTPTAEVIGLVPPGHDGGRGVAYTASGFFAFVAIPADVGGDEDRVRELLRILDYFAAPFGSEERNFVVNGLEGVHHEVQPDGARIRTQLGTTEIGDFPTLMNPPLTYYFPDRPEDGPYMQSLVRNLTEIGLANPALGIVTFEDGSMLHPDGHRRPRAASGPSWTTIRARRAAPRTR
jgi:putative aldouronate transport system substrate-binding protein